ncbi:MAG: LD-carboxypeptidase [Chitinophagaceae bacterium]
MTRIPAYLKKGDTIGIVCPSGYMSLENTQTCMNVLHDWGYAVKTGTTVGGNSGVFFSGTDEERLADLQQMMDDDEVKAILCARGGYGMGRIIGQINFSRFKKKPKWIIGFSDICILLAHLYANVNIASIHAPMAAAFNDEGYKNEYVQSLRNALNGKKAKYFCSSHTFNHKGEAVGELVGGNLALFAHCIGTSSDVKTKGKILFLEDVGEYLYNIDRMLYQCKRSGKLDRLAGLIIGGFSGSKDTERPFGKTAYEIIHDIVKEYRYPVSFNFPVSHEKENYALKVGVGYKLKVTKDKVILEE